MKKSFLRFGTPCLDHPPAPAGTGPAERILADGPVTLLHPRPAEGKAVPAVKVGDRVKAGQPLALYGGPDYVTAPLDGRVSALRPVSGSFGRMSTAVTIAPADDPAFDEEFAAVRSAPTLAGAMAFLAQLPGRPGLGRLRYFFSPLALVDLIAVLPYFLSFLAVDMRFLRALRMLRLLRIAKFGRYSETLALFARVMRHKREELVITGLLMLVLIVLSASLMYFAEHEAQPDKFPDIPTTAWWAVVTLTTVGYGDVFPVTALGKLFASAVAIFGIAMFALPAGIVSSGFVEKYMEARKSRTCPHCGKSLEEAPTSATSVEDDAGRRS